MSIEHELYGGGGAAARLFFGEHARHVPAWLYVQDQGPATVALVGSSMTPGQDNPLRYGAPHYDRGRPDGDYYPHHFVVGEIIIRPHIVIATRAASGHGAGGLLTDGPFIEDMLAQGQLIIGTSAQLADIVHRERTTPWRER